MGAHSNCTYTPSRRPLNLRPNMAKGLVHRRGGQRPMIHSRPGRQPRLQRSRVSQHFHHAAFRCNVPLPSTCGPSSPKPPSLWRWRSPCPAKNSRTQFAHWISHSAWQRLCQSWKCAEQQWCNCAIVQVYDHRVLGPSGHLR